MVDAYKCMLGQNMGLFIPKCIMICIMGENSWWMPTCVHHVMTKDRCIYMQMYVMKKHWCIYKEI